MLKAVLAIALMSVSGLAWSAGSAPVRAQAPAQVPRDVAGAPQAARSGVIVGRVVRAEDNQPLRGARVSLRADGVRDLPSAMTDANGRFELFGLPGAEFILTAAKLGYVTSQFGEARSGQGGMPIAVAAGETVERIDVTLPRGGVVAGTVLDEMGEPVVGAVVRVLRQRYVQGRRRLVAAFDTDRTDDRGMFRIHGIAPGRYALSATLGRPPRVDTLADNDLSSLTPGLGSISFFYPGTPSAAQAQTLDVRAGQELGGLVVTAATPRLATISGVVRMSDGQPLPQRVMVSVAQPLPFSSTGLISTSLTLRPDGTFAVPDLPPGPYTLSATVFPQDGNAIESFVMLAGTAVHVPLVLGRSPVARGRVTFGGVTPPSAPTANVIQFVDENPEVGAVGSRGAQIRSDWTFEASGTFGRRKIRVQPPRGWRLASIRVGDADLTDAVFDFEAGDISGIEIALTNRLAEAAVVVKDWSGRDTRAATVVMFAEDRAKWGPDSRFVSAIRPDASGRFIARTLPPGRYYAAAVEDLEPGDEMDPAVLERLQRSAASVVLREGETVAIELSSVEL